MFVRSPTITNPVSGVIRNGSSPLKVVVAVVTGSSRGATSADRVRDHPDVLGRRAAASADDVHQSRAARTRRAGRSWSRASRRTRRTRSADRRSGSTLPGRSRRARAPRRTARISSAPSEQLTPDDHGLGVLDRGPERLHRLARQRASAPVDDRDRDPAGELGRDVRGRGDRPPSRSACRRSSRSAGGRRRRRAGRDLLGVGLVHLVERDRPERGVLHLGRHRERDVQRADRAGDEPRRVARRRPLASRAPSTFIS